MNCEFNYQNNYPSNGEGASACDDDDSDSEEEEDSKSKLLNWGDNKHSHYHGDTDDLEIRQDVEDAYLEEDLGKRWKKLDWMPWTTQILC